MDEYLTCGELFELVTDYIEDDMPGETRLLFEVHLNRCPPCVNYLGQMRLTIQTMGQLRNDTVSPDVKDALKEAFRNWKQHQLRGQ